jgi:hypothetical protein
VEARWPGRRAAATPDDPVEYGWFCETFGRKTEPLPFDQDDENADLRPESNETVADIVEFYGRARTAADQVINELSVDDVGTAWFGDAVSMRWVLPVIWTSSASSSTEGPEIISGNSGLRTGG